MSFKDEFKKYLIIGGVTIGTIVGLLTWDDWTKKEDRPVRNLIYRATQDVTFAGGETAQTASNIDKYTETKMYRGNIASGDSKLGKYLGSVFVGVTDNTEEYHLRDETNEIIASSTLRNENLQKGMQIRGSTNYQEETSHFGKSHSDNLDELLNYEFEPERALIEHETNVLKKDGKKTMVNKLSERRTTLLGWFAGEKYRAGTTLEYYDVLPDDARVKKFFDLISELNDPEFQDESSRDKKIKEMIAQEKQIPKKPIYVTYEDGIVDWIPQESTMWLAHEPSKKERVAFDTIDWLQQLRAYVTLGAVNKQPTKDMVIRVEHDWDFWPANIIGLNKLKYETDKRIFSLFDKTNNGGYKIFDSHGKLAEIKIKDFWFNYAGDTEYEYYLDLNGDGKLDKKKEFIGKVLYKVTRGQKANLKEQVGEGKEKKDISYTFQYEFMGGTETDLVKRFEQFLLCGAIESLLPDQVNKGYEDSKLGYIAEVRDDIILYENRTFANMNRSLTEENSMVAKEDIYKILKTT
ncbi:MAG: hypothetical protein ABIB43_01330, partial [archaeon]